MWLCEVQQLEVQASLSTTLALIYTLEWGLPPHSKKEPLVVAKGVRVCLHQQVVLVLAHPNSPFQISAFEKRIELKREIRLASVTWFFLWITAVSHTA